MATATDNFTDVAATLLSAHTADTGQTWTRAPSMTVDPVISASGDQLTGGGESISGYYSSFVPALADYTVSATLDATVGGGSVAPGILGRQSTTVDTKLRLYWHGGDPGWRLREVVAGTPADIGTSAAQSPIGFSTPITMQFSGSTVTCTANGVTIITATTTILAAGRPGVIAGDTASNTMTTWSVTDAASLTTSPPMFRGH